MNDEFSLNITGFKSNPLVAFSSIYSIFRITDCQFYSFNIQAKSPIIKISNPKVKSIDLITSSFYHITGDDDFLSFNSSNSVNSLKDIEFFNMNHQDLPSKFYYSSGNKDSFTNIHLFKAFDTNCIFQMKCKTELRNFNSSIIQPKFKLICPSFLNEFSNFYMMLLSSKNDSIVQTVETSDFKYCNFLASENVYFNGIENKFFTNFENCIFHNLMYNRDDFDPNFNKFVNCQFDIQNQDRKYINQSCNINYTTVADIYIQHQYRLNTIPLKIIKVEPEQSVYSKELGRNSYQIHNCYFHDLFSDKHSSAVSIQCYYAFIDCQSTYFYHCYAESYEIKLPSGTFYFSIENGNSSIRKTCVMNCSSIDIPQFAYIRGQLSTTSAEFSQFAMIKSSSNEFYNGIGNYFDIKSAVSYSNFSCNTASDRCLFYSYMKSNVSFCEISNNTVIERNSSLIEVGSSSRINNCNFISNKALISGYYVRGFHYVDSCFVKNNLNFIENLNNLTNSENVMKLDYKCSYKKLKLKVWQIILLCVSVLAILLLVLALSINLKNRFMYQRIEARHKLEQSLATDFG